MDVDAFLKWLQLGALAANAAVIPAAAWFIRAARRGLVETTHLDGRLKERDVRVSGIEQRVSSMEHSLRTLGEKVQELPDGDDFAELRVTLAGLSSDVKGYGREVGSIQKSVTRIEDFLLNKGGKA